MEKYLTLTKADSFIKNINKWIKMYGANHSPMEEISFKPQFLIRDIKYKIIKEDSEAYYITRMNIPLEKQYEGDLFITDKIIQGTASIN